MLNRKYSLKYFRLLATAFVAIMLSSCGKQDNASPGGLNVRLLIANLSPDLNPVYFYINNLRQGTATTTYTYNTTPAYFYLSTTNQPLQLRSASTDSIVFRMDTVSLRSDTRYSIFVMGLRANKSIKAIFLADDTTQLAPVGKGGKLRFINGSPANVNYDVWANGTPILKNIQFSKVSPYVTLPPGGYTFRIYQAGTSATDLANIANVTIQDGRLYTLYSKGLPNRAQADTTRLSLGFIANNNK